MGCIPILDTFPNPILDVFPDPILDVFPDPILDVFPDLIHKRVCRQARKNPKENW